MEFSIIAQFPIWNTHHLSGPSGAFADLLWFQRRILFSFVKVNLLVEASEANLNLYLNLEWCIFNEKYMTAVASLAVTRGLKIYIKRILETLPSL